MKKMTLTISGILLMLFTFASIPASVSTKATALRASEIKIPIGNSGKQISLLELSKINRKDLEALTGKKMTLAERLTFHAAQRKLKNSINPDGTINNKKLNKLLEKNSAGPTEGFHLLGFVLGFLLGLIGVLLAYVINSDDDKRNRVKWAWIGFGIELVLYLILVVAILSSGL